MLSGCMATLCGCCLVYSTAEELGERGVLYLLLAPSPPASLWWCWGPRPGRCTTLMDPLPMMPSWPAAVTVVPWYRLVMRSSRTNNNNNKECVREDSRKLLVSSYRSINYVMTIWIGPLKLNSYCVLITCLMYRSLIYGFSTLDMSCKGLDEMIEGDFGAHDDGGRAEGLACTDPHQCEWKF